MTTKSPTADDVVLIGSPGAGPVDKAGDPVGQPQNGPPTVGENWFENDELNRLVLRAGLAPGMNAREHLLRRRRALHQSA
mgnify:CR=1 FL=1